MLVKVKYFMLVLGLLLSDIIGGIVLLSLGLLILSPFYYLITIILNDTLEMWFNVCVYNKDTWAYLLDLREVTKLECL